MHCGDDRNFPHSKSPFAVLSSGMLHVSDIGKNRQGVRYMYINSGILSAFVLRLYTSVHCMSVKGGDVKLNAWCVDQRHGDVGLSSM